MNWIHCSYINNPKDTVATVPQQSLTPATVPQALTLYQFEKKIMELTASFCFSVTIDLGNKPKVAVNE